MTWFQGDTTASTRAEALEQLAAFAEKLGFVFGKFETLGDMTVIRKAVRWEHCANLALIREQVPRARRLKVSRVDLRLTSEPQEPVPDLIVLFEQLAPGAKPWAHETELLVEAVSQNDYRADYEGKRRRYAQSGAPQYLLVDARDGVCVLHTRPIKSTGTYEKIVTTEFGAPVVGLTCMDGGDLDTSELLRFT